jgi:hypothetical protein
VTGFHLFRLPIVRAVHDRADADTAHKMRRGCDPQGLLGSTFKPFQEFNE